MLSTNKTARRARWALGVSTVALTLALGVNASPAAAQGSGTTVGEVVVTAQFREQNLQKTPIAITAVNAQMLESRSQTSVYEVAAQAPNVTLKPAGAAFGPSLQASIRGVGQGDFNFALEPGVGMYVDDVYYSTLTGNIFDLLDLDRVEILRGPQGTLAGKNSIGGAVKLYSMKPTGEGGGSVEATYGSLDRVDVRASADLAIVPEKLFMRIAGVSKHHDGYVDRIDYACANPGSGLLPQTTGAGGCKLGTEGGQSMNSVRAAMRWLVTDKIEVNLAGDFTSDNSEVQANTLLGARTIPWITGDDGDPATPPVVYGPQFIPADPYVTYSTFTDPGGVFAAFGPPGATVTKQAYQIPPVNTLKAWGTSGTIDWQLTETLSMKSITAYRAYRSDFAEDVDNSPLNAELVMNHLTHRQFSEEVRFNGSIGSAVDYTVGGFYFWQKSVNRNRVDIPYVAPQPVGTYFDFTSNDPVVAHSKSGFAHAIWHITDRLNLAGGVRYTAEDKDYTYSRLNPDGTPNPILGALTGVTGHFEGTRWDWRANADYQLTSEMMVYAQFSTGFKGGGINPRPFSVAQVKPFGPEQLDAYELGLKSYWLDRSVRVNISAFFNKYKDIQLTLLACPTSPCAQPNNAGDADVKGFEVETEIHPVEGLTIDGALSYLDFEYTRIDPNAGGPTQPAGVQVGMVTPFTPKWKWSVGAQYEFQMGDNGTLTPRVDASYQGAIFSGAVNCGPISPACAYADSNRVPAYTLVNGRVTWRSADRDWQASLQATNLTNKLYYYQIFDLLGLAGFQSGQPAAPRQWAVTVKRRF